MPRSACLILLGLALTACMARRSDATQPLPSGAVKMKAAPAVGQNFARAPAVRAGDSPTTALVAENGVARMPIVVSAEASKETRQAAVELAGFLGQATGGHFDVTTGDGSRGIVVGLATEFDVGPDAASLALKGEFDGPEAFVIRTEPARVLIVGATERGVPHAVYAFLEALGFRWYFPAKEWEEIPTLRTLRADLHVAERPRILSRQMSPGFGFFDGQAQSDWLAWQRRNRVGESLHVRANHTWDVIISTNRKEFDAHPEYFALSGGKRLTNKLCVTNPHVQKLVIAYAMKALANPGVEMASVESSDGMGYCECDRCKAIGPPSAQPYYLANIVAREVQKAGLHKLVGLLAYAEHSEPPPFPLEPNVFVQIANGYVYGKYSVADLVEMWPKLTRYVGHYQYVSVYQSDYDVFPRGCDPRYLADIIRYYVAHSSVALTAETGNNWGPCGRSYYAMSRFMWNPETDPEALLSDFYSGAFHAGAPMMRRFYDRFDPGKGLFLAPSLLRAGYDDIAEAARATAGDARVAARLDQLKAYLHYVYSQFELGTTKDLEARRPIALDVLTEGYRSRRSYMNHWRAMLSMYSPQSAKEYNEPSWNRATPGPHPWQVDTPLLHAELETRFQKERLLLPVRVPVPAPVFSKHLVRVRLDATLRRPVEKTQFALYTPQRFALSSDDGEPIEFTVKTALIAAYKNKPAAHYFLRDASEHVVAEGKVPLDWAFHTLVHPVPAPGVYYLDFNDSGAGYALSVPVGHAATFVQPENGKAPTIGATDRFFFYVPKGTKTVEYYWDGYPHTVHGPDGVQIQAVNTRGDWIRVPVPPGLDGKLWFLLSARVGILRFSSVPNNVATASDALLVPEDVARADGLQIVSPSKGIPAVSASPISSASP